MIIKVSTANADEVATANNGGVAGYLRYQQGISTVPTILSGIWVIRTSMNLHDHASYIVALILRTKLL